MTYSLWEGSPDAEILCINTAGKGGQDSIRIRRLTKGLSVSCAYYDVDKSAKKRATGEIWRLITSKPWRLLYLENTGLAGGMNMIRAARERGIPYIVSSGDPIEGFFRVTKGDLIGKAFGVYEKLLMRYSSGFVGWSPYLAGRALELGAPRSATIEGAVDRDVFYPLSETERAEVRRHYGITPGHLVCGIVGSLTWNERVGYTYGLELVEAARRLKREDVTILIVGDGTGKSVLEERVPEALRRRVIFTGRIAADEVMRAMNTMDIGFITQTLDHLGSYRLTTKMPEYLACGLPIAMSPIPGFFDYIGEAAGWALPPYHPASPAFHDALTGWLETVDRVDIESKRAACVRIAAERFDYDVIAARFRSFVNYVLSLPR